MAKVYGYLRVSTNKGQTTDNQKIEILNAYPQVDEWFSEEAVSGAVPAFSRPKFQEMVSQCKEGDTVVVVKIDRLGRNSIETLQTIRKLQDEYKVALVILQLGKLELNTPVGKLMLSMLTAVAEMERDLVVERVNSGLDRAREEGKALGAPLKLEPTVLEDMINQRRMGFKLKDIAEKHNVHASLVDRNIKRWEGKMGEYRKEFEKREAQYKLSVERKFKKVGYNV